MALRQLSASQFQSLRQLCHRGQPVVLQLEKRAVGQAEKLPLSAVSLKNPLQLLQRQLVCPDIHVQKPGPHGDPHPDAWRLHNLNPFQPVGDKDLSNLLKAAYPLADQSIDRLLFLLRNKKHLVLQVLVRKEPFRQLCQHMFFLKIPVHLAHRDRLYNVVPGLAVHTESLPGDLLVVPVKIHLNPAGLGLVLFQLLVHLTAGMLLQDRQHRCAERRGVLGMDGILPLLPPEQAAGNMKMPGKLRLTYVDYVIYQDTHLVSPPEDLRRRDRQPVSPILLRPHPCLKQWVAFLKNKGDHFIIYLRVNPLPLQNPGETDHPIVGEVELPLGQSLRVIAAVIIPPIIKTIPPVIYLHDFLLVADILLQKI